ncbi:MAG: ThuA domain-containing protein [Bacillota bacterium]
MTKRILAILGDYYHKEELLSQSLDNAVQKVRDKGEQIEVEYITENQLVEKLQLQPAAVVLSKANKLNPTDRQVKNWMDKNCANAICQYVKNGGGWFAWHSGLSSYENLNDYYSMVRGKFDYHPTEHRVVTYSPKSNPSFLPIKVHFEMVDEHYFVTCDEVNTNVFLRADSTDGSSISGWSHEYGNGRVIALTPAHNKEGLLHYNMIELLSQTLKWSCGIAYY